MIGFPCSNKQFHVLCRILVNQRAQFRKQCNAFFVDLVSTVCFKDNAPPCSAVILHLLSFLMVDVKSVPILKHSRGRSLFQTWSLCLCTYNYVSANKYSSVLNILYLMFLTDDRKILTKVLSPFDDSVDKNPVVRSVVLKLLLKYRYVAVVAHYAQI